MMNSNIYFSIVIPTYNRAHLISYTIHSILKQSYTNFEIIIVDDGSVDDTELVIKKHFGSFDFIKYYKKENEERGKARNFGFKKSIGDFIIFFDSDDLMLDTYLEVLVQNIEEDTNFVAAKFIFTNQNGKVIGSGNKNQPARAYNYLDFLKGNFLACHFAIRRDNPSLQLFNEDRQMAILEDWIFLIENLRNDKLKLIDKVCIQMLQHDNRSMGDNQVVIKRRLKALDYLTEKINFNKSETKIIRAYSNLFCGIHAYLDNNRSQCLDFVKKAYNDIGLTKGLIALILKNIIGFKNIRTLKYLLHK